MSSNLEDTVAIILSDRGVIKSFLSYKEVNNFCESITLFLKEHLIGPHQCIGLQMSYNIYIPSIILSLQKLEHAFIFLLECESGNCIIKKLGIPWILTFSYDEKCELTLCLKEDTKLALLKQDVQNIKKYKDIFYVIKTSGTTGDHKFVKVGKQSIESNIECLSKIFNIKNSDIIYFGTPLTFDPSMVELLLALKNYGTLLITSEQNRINPNFLYETLFHPKNGISVLQIVPSLFLRWSKQQILNILMNEKLKILAFGGENFPETLLNYDRSQVRLFNLYGITEVSCWATIFEITEQTKKVSLGKALKDTIVEVRKNNEKITKGEGEIFIGSKDRVCLINDENTKDGITFRETGDIANIENDEIFYKDRKNNTFKRFGHRINLSKIEELIFNETETRNTCVWLKSESKLLTFFIIENFEEKVKDKIIDKIRVKLLHSLPKQYFPDYIDIIRNCPVTSHGKIHTKTLEKFYLQRDIKQRDGSQMLKTLLCRCLALSEDQLLALGENTFFEIGGNSILATQILNEFADDNPDFVNALFEKNINTCLEKAKFIKIPNKRLLSDNKINKKIKTGIELKVAWTYNFEACVDSTALIFKNKGQTLVAIGSFSHIFAIINVENGEEVAKFCLPDVIEGSPCISECTNFVYIGCFDGNLYCLDFNNKKIKWTYQTSDRIKSKPSLLDKSLVFGSYDQHIHCINAKDGAQIWKTNVEESVISSALSYKGKIFVATISGTCLGLSSGSILWKYKSGNPIFGSPCIMENFILWPNVQGRILCLSLDGKKITEYHCGGYLFSSMVSFNDLIIVGCHDQCLYILNFDKGVFHEKIIIKVGDSLTTPCIFGNKIAVTGNSGQLFLVDFDGHVVGNLELGNEVFSSAVVYEDKIFFGCRDNKFYCIYRNK